jgi:hypothetical protein
MSNNLTPLEVSERLIAPLEELGPLCGLGLKAAYMWRNASKQRAAGDIAPVYARRLLAHSARHGLGLTADHLIWGAPEDEIAAILAARAQTAATPTPPPAQGVAA